MKPATPRRGLLSHLPSVFACLSLGILTFGSLGQASAEAPATGVLVPSPVPAVAETDAGAATEVPESATFSSLMAGLGLVLLLRRRC